MLLTPTEAAAIEARVAKLKAERGVEVVTLIARKSDDYPEAVWKAFAFGAAAAGKKPATRAGLSSGVADYCLRLRVPARPARAIPRRERVAGSGAGLGSGVWPASPHS